MKLYRINWLDRELGTRYGWAGTQVEAKQAKATALAAIPKHDHAYAGIEVEDIDVPTDKPGLLAWLNENVNRDPDKEE